MIRVKICGITSRDDAWAAVEAGADALGFIFVEGTPRYIEPEAAAAIIAQLPPFVTTVGVFIDRTPEEIERIVRVCGLALYNSMVRRVPTDAVAFTPPSSRRSGFRGSAIWRQ